ncbi:hypothetical protein COHCIP112018_01914 [Cohnella sp. JJ-181]|nr:hypothetical protein COHCIP112018_01914 [Cohnella sp. JJ-181]
MASHLGKDRLPYSGQANNDLCWIGEPFAREEIGWHYISFLNRTSSFIALFNVL